MNNDAPPANISLVNVSLESLIGSILTSIVQADVMVAQAIVTFIQEIGFKEAQDTNLGELKMVSIRSQWFDRDGAMQWKTIQVPLLSLFPLPMLMIDEAELKFFARLSIENSGITETDKAQSGSSSQARVMASFAPMTGSPTDQQLDVLHLRVRMRTHDLPDGVLRLLNLMHNMVMLEDNENPNGS